MIPSFRLLILICLGAITGRAQINLHVGIEGGVPVGDTLSSYSSVFVNGADYSLNRFNSVTKRLLIGPSLRLELPKGLGLEFDALYQRVNYDYTNSSSTAELPSFYENFEAVTANRWQFPLLVQYSRKIARIEIFLEAGPAISAIVNTRGTSTTQSTFSLTSGATSTTTTTTTAVSGQGGTFAGITTGAGLDLPLFHSHLRPEFRYSHWFSPNSSTGTVIFSGIFVLGPSVAPPFSVEQDEVSFLLGLSF